MIRCVVQPCLRRTSARAALSERRRAYQILAIESSADDTCVAVLQLQKEPVSPAADICKASVAFNSRITANSLQYGGIHPLRSLESHQSNLAHLVAQARGHISGGIPDLIAVTRGPGARNNLQCGLDTAKGLSVAWNKPLVPVHHMQAHALTPRLDFALNVTESNADSSPLPVFPFLSLLVSGGHTLLVKSSSVNEHSVVASTVDIALGDCLDKVARAILPPEILDGAASVAYGSLLEEFAFGRSDDQSSVANGYGYDPPRSTAEERRRDACTNAYGWRIPAPMLNSSAGKRAKSLEFSFSGLTSAVGRIVAYGSTHRTQRTDAISTEERRELARDAMTVAFEHLASRLCLLLSQENQTAPGNLDTVSLTLSGGVAANYYLRHVLREYLKVRGYQVVIHAPSRSLCTDNAVMIAWAAAETTGAARPGASIISLDSDAHSSLSVRALRKWSLNNLLTPEKEELREREEERVREGLRVRKTSISV